MQSIPDRNNRNYRYDIEPVLEPLPATSNLSTLTQLHQQAQPSATKRTKRIPTIQSPIDRATLAKYQGWYWLILALIAGGISAVSTTQQTSDLLAFMTIWIDKPTARLLVGLAVFVVIFTGQLITSGNHRLAYALLLAIDVAFTLSWSAEVLTVTAYKMGLPSIAGLAVGALVATFVAWLPERVLLGQRRGKQWSL